jgi:hypothetical protein
MHAVGRLVASADASSHLSPDELQRLVSEEGSALIASRDRAAALTVDQLRRQEEATHCEP